MIYRFPKEEKVRRLWLRVICSFRNDKINADFARICEKHFEASDYEPDMKSAILGISTRKVLKPNAVPHKNLPTSPPVAVLAENSKKEICANKRRLRTEEREDKKVFPWYVDYSSYNNMFCAHNNAFIAIIVSFQFCFCERLDLKLVKLRWMKLSMIMWFKKTMFSSPTTKLYMKKFSKKI